jgi:hypothetical protein
VHFVVNLAWGLRKPSGIAGLDEYGALVRIDIALLNGEIVEAVAPYVAGDGLFTIDTPLIVNSTSRGRRPVASIDGYNTPEALSVVDHTMTPSERLCDTPETPLCPLFRPQSW